MMFVVFILLIGVVFGVVSVVSNPSPYFAALGLVILAAIGGGILIGYKGAFLSLVFFLIYLGGILVVFAYCAALAADPHPGAWGEWSVLGSVVGYLLLVLGWAYWFGSEWYEGDWLTADSSEFSVVSGDLGGVAMMYSSGGGLLVVAAWVLLLTLFVVLELTRGLSRGALRAIRVLRLK